MKTTWRRNRRGGWTLLDTLLAIVLAAVLMTMLIQNVPSWLRVSEKNQMKTKAVELNNAMTNYMGEGTIRDRITQWTPADNDTRYNLVRPYLQRAPAAIGQYLVEGWKVTFPDDPRNSVTVTDPDGNVLEYQ